MNNDTILSPFAEDVMTGLTAKNKFIPSKYFYDDAGSRIFMQIMAMPEYYPTGCEFEILTQQSHTIVNRLPFSGHFNVIELGCGDGMKTIHLLKALNDINADFTYIPIDISQEAINTLQANIKAAFPTIDMQPRTGDYFEEINGITGESPSLYLFLGGNIGNYQPEEATGLLDKFNIQMKKGDMLLIGMDLQKNPRIVQKAYDDPHGITRAFNLNLLTRINRELEANINIDQFEFYCDYNPQNGEVHSYLVSLKKQSFYSAVLDKTFYLEKDELIWTELSKKFTPAAIDELALATGFVVDANFMDCRHYFTDSLWIK